MRQGTRGFVTATEACATGVHVQLLDHWAEGDAAITALIEVGAFFVGRPDA
jgi:hypothetical protein